MDDPLAEFGNHLEVFSTAFLGVAVLLRAPSAVRFPQQRGLWLAVATAAIAMALNLPILHDLFVTSATSGHLVGMVRSLIGVISAGAVLYFITSSVGPRRLLPWVVGATCIVLIILAGLDLAAGSVHPPTIASTSAPVPSLQYWLILASAHLSANTICAWVCWNCSQTARPLLKWGLWLFGLGTAIVGIFWVGILLLLLTSWTWVVPFLPFTLGIHALLRAAAILIPTISAAHRAGLDMRTVWTLWPMWRDLVAAVPHVKLTERRPRLLELLWPRVSWRLLAYRKEVEIRDAILALRVYASPDMLEKARHYLTEANIAEDGRDAALLASVIHAARRAKLAEQPPLANPACNLVSDCGDQDGDAFLLRVAAAYASPHTRQFSDLVTTPCPEGR